MATIVNESDLPKDLDCNQAIEAGYCTQLQDISSKLQKGMPVLVECEKDMAPYVFVNLRNRLKQVSLKCLYLDGRPREDDEGPPMGIIATMINHLRGAVRGAVERRVVVLPHLDLLTTSSGGLTSEAKEVIPLMYENPEIVWLGFKDPSFAVPSVIENLFLHTVNMVGTNRNRLVHLITQKEAKKFGKEFNPFQLYKYVSGVNAVRLRRLLQNIEGEDYPVDPKHAIRQVRAATLTGGAEIPNVNLEKDIGGYEQIKKRLREDILDLLTRRDGMSEEEDISRIESLIPRGMLFAGPPGTGKSYLAKAMATALGASFQVVSGPELKSKWVGESEQNLRRVFHQARMSAPSIIVFDEIDSFATARGTYEGSGVEHSMVNQLLTEMDGFHKEEMVFVVGTTNFVESLDPALLRPGRFEFHLTIGYPDADDRRDILKIYNEKMKLKMSEDALEAAVRETSYSVPGASMTTKFSGDHLEALCRAIARKRLREGKTGNSEPKDITAALTGWMEKPKMTSKELNILATHEAGHAIAALFCKNAPPIERVTIESEMQWAFGYVKYADPTHKFIQTEGFYRDMICVALAARESERLLLKELSLGATGDLQSATAIAREIVEVHGFSEEVGQVRYRWDRNEHERHPQLSQERLAMIDKEVAKIIDVEQKRAAAIIRKNRGMVESMRKLLLEKKTLDVKALAAFSPPKEETK